MIPKIIHYCWLSNDPVPKQLQAYMDTWHKLMPEYEFIKWDFSRFDKESSVWVSEAFDNKKYAFAADYIRMFALYTMGGIYLDMDVEVLKSFDDLLELNYFICNERDAFPCPEVAAFGTEKGCEWVKIMMDYYQDRHFVRPDGTFDTEPLPHVFGTVLKSHGYTFKAVESRDAIESSTVDSKVINLFPYTFFSPKSYKTGKVHITKETYSVHRFTGTWKPWYIRMEKKFWRALGLKPYTFTAYLEPWLQKRANRKKGKKD